MWALPDVTRVWWCEDQIPTPAWPATQIDAEVERVGLDVSKHGKRSVNGVDMIATVGAQPENKAV